MESSAIGKNQYGAVVIKEEIDIEWDENEACDEEAADENAEPNLSAGAPSCPSSQISIAKRAEPKSDSVLEDVQKSPGGGNTLPINDAGSKYFLRHSRSNRNSINNYSCANGGCNYTTYFRSKLHEHYKARHMEMRRCEICKEWFNSIELFEKHDRKACEIEASLRLKNGRKASNLTNADTTPIFTVKQEVNPDVLEHTNLKNNQGNLESTEEQSQGDGDTLLKNDAASKCNKYCPAKCKKSGKAITSNFCKTCGVQCVFQCKICKSERPSYKNFIRHLRTTCEIIRNYSCAHGCNFETHFRWQLDYHYKSAHKQMRGCKICKEWFNSKELFEKHREACEAEANSRNEDKLKNGGKSKRKSRGSGKRVASKPVSLDSLDIEVKDVKYENFDTIKGLREQTRKYCLNCDMTVEHDPDLGIVRYQKCDKCKNRLKWQCNKCGKRCATCSGIDCHTRHVCYIRKMYRCMICKTFEGAEKAKILIHYHNTHSDEKHEKVFKCPKCKDEKTFKNDTTLRSHVRNCGAEKKIKCAHCPYKTYTKFNVMKHLRSVHKSKCY